MPAVIRRCCGISKEQLQALQRALVCTDRASHSQSAVQQCLESLIASAWVKAGRLPRHCQESRLGVHQVIELGDRGSVSCQARALARVLKARA